MSSFFAILLPTPPNEYKPVPSSLITFLIVLLPLCTSTFLSCVLHYVASAKRQSIRFSIASNSSPSPFLSVYQEQTPTFLYIGAITTLPFQAPNDLIIVSDFPSNSLYTIASNNPSLSYPFLSDAGYSRNETLAASLLRPGIGSFAVLQTRINTDGIEECDLLVGENSARSLSLLTVQPSAEISRIYRPHIVSRKPLVTSFNSSLLNSPNDIHVDDRGNIFFVDGYFGLVESVDVFNRKIDNPPNHNLTQNVYYVTAMEVDHAKTAGKHIEPHILLENIDRPTGVAVSRNGDRLFVMLGSPRSPHLLEYELEFHAPDNKLEPNHNDQVGHQTIIAHSPMILYDWSTALHQWEQGGFTSISGNIVVDKKDRLYVGVGNGVAVFDVHKRRPEVKSKSPLAWISTNVPPGPPRLSIHREKWLHIGISDAIATVVLD